MELVTVKTFFLPAEADLLVSRLEAAGFQVFVEGLDSALTSGFTQFTSGIRVKVPEDRHQEVLEFLASEKTDAA
jgi:hypothetical protein